MFLIYVCCICLNTFYGRLSRTLTHDFHPSDLSSFAQCMLCLASFLFLHSPQNWLTTKRGRHIHINFEIIAQFMHFKHCLTIYPKTLQELRMLSSVTINCQLTKIVINPGSQSFCQYCNQCRKCHKSLWLLHREP